MIYLYPANKTENLLVLLDKIQQISPLPIFAKDVVVVQNAGMQHWLNMSLAKRRGISMNIDYALPSQFLWKLVRAIASDEDVPDQSPFSREVLAWRIFELLAHNDIVSDTDFSSATHYWLGDNAIDSQYQFSDINQIDESDEQSLKRYQLACQMADLYEQYLIFRPTWIDHWENGNFIADIEDDDAQRVAKWQGKLWYLLTRKQSYNPITLIEKAVQQLANKTSELPHRVSFFGINIMAPMWLSFINELSEYTDVHFFHLNPCYAYWGDVITEKQAVKSIQYWVEGFDDISQTVGNPLLANLGQQGREFMALLHDYSTINIEAFDNVFEDEHSNIKSSDVSVLQRIQNDILVLEDARQNPNTLVDQSVIITSCHSALREVQGLHDWLLHQFNQDPELTPKDVLVMCPHVEDYAPYVNAVFARGWQELDDEIPPLPCSIADRISKESEPVVAAFSDILALPDSRFQVSQLLSFLRIPAMQTKFGLTNEDFDKITVWLDQAAVHWGLDQTHKQQVLQSNAATNNFTWQQGFSRLIQGFAFGDHEAIYNDQLLLPTVEGNDGELLGKLMLIIEQLQSFAFQLTQSRTPLHWHSFLNGLIEELFDTTEDDGFIIVQHAIESLVEYCGHAEFEQTVSLVIVRDFLNQHFSQPEPGRQFMVGQVTFCSMLPMRSIPFKVIAILGLNDGLFPRQRQPLSFDLMSNTPAKLGDRSRRGDDRYLFLEAIISARDVLYLSYQGKNIKNNAVKQPSLVLTELMEYLTLGFGWDFNENTDKKISQLRALPMQPFSENNYRGQYKSFDRHWLTLAKSSYNEKTLSQITLSASSALESLIGDDESNNGIEGSYIPISASSLVSFYQHPSRAFAKKQLNLSYENYDLALEDTEPFDFDRLETYLLREVLLEESLVNEFTEMNFEHTLHRARLSGKFPETITREVTFEKYVEETRLFSETIKSANAASIERINTEINLSLTLELDNVKRDLNVILAAELPIANNILAFHRSSSPKFKDFFTLYLHQLLLQVAQQQCCDNPLVTNAISSTHGFYFDTKSQKVTQYRYSDLKNPFDKLTQLVHTYFTGLCKPLLLNGEIAEKAFKAKKFEQEEFEKYWLDANAFMPIGNDPYIKFFWPKCPDVNDVIPNLESMYLDMYNTRELVK